MNSRSNALLIALLVALSTFGALPVGSATSAVATSSTADLGQETTSAVDRTQLQVEGADASLQSGTRYWQGWELGVDTSQFIEEGDRSIEVWRVSSDGQLSQRVNTVSVSDDGSVVFGTNDLDGRYVLQYGGNPVYLHEGRGYLSSPPDGTTVTVATSSFRVTPQTLAHDWSDPEVFPGQATELSITSNRDRFRVAVSGTGLSYQNLTTLFPNSTFANNHDARAADDQLLLTFTNGSTLRLSTHVLEPGSQRLTINPVDTTARTRVTLTVKQPAENRRFVSVESREHVGDVIETEIACNDCFVVIGAPEQDVLDVVELRDRDGDGRINLSINTRYVGLYSGNPGFPSNINPYTAPDAAVVRYGPGTTLEQIDEELSYTVNSLGQLRNQFNLPTNGRIRPIEPGQLQVTVAQTDFLIDRSAWGDRPPFGSELVIRDETDARTVELRPRSLEGVQPMAAPGGSGFEPTAESLRTEAGPRDQLALGDRLVFRIDVPGIHGYLNTHGASIDALRNNRDEGIDMSLSRLSGGSEVDIRIEQLNVQLIHDPSSDALYVVFRTGADHVGYLTADRYRLTFTLEGVSAQYDAYSTQNAFEGYPYLEPGSEESASETVSVEPAEASITSPVQGESTRLTSDGRLEIAGTSTVAAGTALRVHVAAAEYAWNMRVGATVNETGHWLVAADLSEAPGDEFTIEVSRDNRVLAEGTYTVQASLTANESTPTSGNSGDGGDDSDGGGLDNINEGGPIIPGISNIVLIGGVLIAVLVIILLWRA